MASKTREVKKELADAATVLREARWHLRWSSSRLPQKRVEQLRAAEAELAQLLVGDSPDLEAVGRSVDKVGRLLKADLKPHRWKFTLFEYVRVIGVAVFIALMLRTFVVEPFKIPSGSMIPTLLVGDHIFVNKFSYGVWLPWPFSRKVNLFGSPKRGEVVVFRHTCEETRDFVKRIIGLPGDTIEVKGGTIYVNGKAAVRSKGKRFTYTELEGGAKVRYSGQLWSEDLTGLKHVALHDDLGSPTRDAGPFKIKPGHLFMMGDNRDHSDDSRVWGPTHERCKSNQVPIANVKGRAMIIWLSLGDPGGFLKSLFTWRIRWKRFGTTIK